MKTFPSHSCKPRRREAGVALAVGLLILLIITVVTVVSLRSSVFELQMARNEEARMSAFERAQSIIDGTVAIASNLIVAGDVGDTNCAGSYYPGCTSTSVTLSNGIPINDPNEPAWEQGRVSVRVERLAPELKPAPRVVGSSANVFEAAQFKVEGTYDARSTREGKASLAQGVMVLVATGRQSNIGSRQTNISSPTP